jgi:Sulfotransferase domain
MTFADEESQAGIKGLLAEVIGLYSFPKSGNTWIRQIVASALGVPANQLHRYVTDMHYSKIMQHPFIYNNKRLYIYKSHHRQLVTEHKGQVIRNTKVVYIYRHPMDVFLSYVNFVSKNAGSKATTVFQFEIESVEKLTSEQLDTLFSVYMVFGTLTPHNRLFGGYFEHVFGAFALRDKGFPIHIMRYEDLHNDFEGTVAGMLKFLQIGSANLKDIFAEADRRTAQDGKFFWKRQAENYKNYLTEQQIGKFNKTFADQLKFLGYPVSA